MRFGVPGSGVAGEPLTGDFLGHGREVMIAAREPAKLAEWARQHPGARLGTSHEPAVFGDLAALAVKGTAAAALLRTVDAGSLAGKTLLDPRAPSSRCASPGASPDFETTSGRMPSRCSNSRPSLR